MTWGHWCRICVWNLEWAIIGDERMRWLTRLYRHWRLCLLNLLSGTTWLAELRPFRSIWVKTWEFLSIDCASRSNPGLKFSVLIQMKIFVFEERNAIAAVAIQYLNSFDSHTQMDMIQLWYFKNFIWPDFCYSNMINTAKNAGIKSISNRLYCSLHVMGSSSICMYLSLQL